MATNCGLPIDEKSATGDIRLATRKQCAARTALSKWKLLAVGLTSAVAVGTFAYSSFFQQSTPSAREPVTATGTCKLHPKLYPSGYNESSLDIFHTEAYRKQVLDTFVGAIQIPSESFDDLGPVGEDPRWEIFGEFAAYLKKTYPLVHSTLDLAEPHTYGKVFTWEGSDASLDPVVLMAHQDVVPVLNDTADLWTYPPFSGHFDGEFVWGRGTLDCKNTLVAILDAVELLIHQGFAPERTVILSFGFDEESSGKQGAAYNAKHLEELYGTDYPFFSIIDEGWGVGRAMGVSFAAPVVAEKGYADVIVTVHTAGGHSSMPPDHTGIGKLAQFITLVENTPYPAQLSHVNPVLGYLECMAEHSPTMPESLKDAIFNVETDKKSKATVLDLLDKNPLSKWLVKTSQAIDVINGGLKINALPEKVSVQINHRIDRHLLPDDVISKLVKNAISIAKQYNMAVKHDGKFVIGNEKSEGYFEIDYIDSPKVPSPLSPSEGPAWEALAGTVRHVFEDWAAPLVEDGKEVHDPFVLVPMAMTPNTDTRYFWNLSKNIYRFSPTKLEGMEGIHTVDEKVRFDYHVEAIVFFYEYLRTVC